MEGAAYQPCLRIEAGAWDLEQPFYLFNHIEMPVMMCVSTCLELSGCGSEETTDYRQTSDAVVETDRLSEIRLPLLF